PAARHLPSGENATAMTTAGCSPITPLRLARRHVPEADGLVRASGSQRLAVRAEGEAMDGLLMGLPTVQFPTRRHVPEADGLVVTTRRQRLAVRREYDSVDIPSVTCDRADFLSRGHVPESEGPLHFLPAHDDPYSAVGRCRRAAIGGQPEGREGA